MNYDSWLESLYQKQFDNEVGSIEDEPVIRSADDRKMARYELTHYNRRACTRHNKQCISRRGRV